jgi:hypothetical protein
MSVLTPIDVPLMITFAKGNGWLLDPLSKRVPATIPLFCANPNAQMNNVINTNFNFIFESFNFFAKITATKFFRRYCLVIFSTILYYQIVTRLNLG